MAKKRDQGPMNCHFNRSPDHLFLRGLPTSGRVPQRRNTAAGSRRRPMLATPPVRLSVQFAVPLLRLCFSGVVNLAVPPCAMRQVIRPTHPRFAWACCASSALPRNEFTPYAPPSPQPTAPPRVLSSSVVVSC